MRKEDRADGIIVRLSCRISDLLRIGPKALLIRVIKSVRIAKGAIETLMKRKAGPSGRGAVSLLFFIFFLHYREVKI